jgi:peroxiredoxin
MITETCGAVGDDLVADIVARSTANTAPKAAICLKSPESSARATLFQIGIHYYSWVRRPAHFVPLLLPCLFLISLSGCYSGSRPPRIGSNAPEFTVQDADRTVKLSDFRGQVVVLNFWATWCPPCVEEMPSLVEMQRRMKGKGVTVVGVSVDVDQNAYHQFLKDHNVNLLTVRDPGQKSNDLYGTFKFPETYIIDRNGVMRRKFIGAVDWTAPEITDFLAKL